MIFGGDETFARRMNEALPTARIYPSGVSWDDAAVRDAPEFWFRTAYIGHSEFYRAIGIARTYNIPVCYFSGNGIRRCLDDMRRVD